MVTYTAKFGEPVNVPIPSSVGAQQEAYCSALGKILLASLSSRGGQRLVTHLRLSEVKPPSRLPLAMDDPAAEEVPPRPRRRSPRTPPAPS